MRTWTRWALPVVMLVLAGWSRYGRAARARTSPLPRPACPPSPPRPHCGSRQGRLRPCPQPEDARRPGQGTRVVTDLVEITLLTQDHCGFCESAKQILGRPGTVYPLRVTEIDL